MLSWTCLQPWYTHIFYPKLFYKTWQDRLIIKASICAFGCKQPLYRIFLLYRKCSIMGADRGTGLKAARPADCSFCLWRRSLAVISAMSANQSWMTSSALFRDVLGEMRPIRYIESPNTNAFITPFAGQQVDICEAFGFDVPEDCVPEYVVRKTNKGKRGRHRKNKLVVKEWW